jgi:hypothetical protein
LLFFCLALFGVYKLCIWLSDRPSGEIRSWNGGAWNNSFSIIFKKKKKKKLRFKSRVLKAPMALSPTLIQLGTVAAHPDWEIDDGF